MTEAGTPEQVDLQPVGTGPFQLVAYQKDAVIRYQAHPDYWQGKAAIDDLVFAITPDASVRWQKLQAGECHVMPYPNPADLEAMRGQSRHQRHRAGGPERRLSRLQYRERAVRRRQGPPGAQHGGRQAGDHRRRVPGRRHDRQEPDPANHVVLQRCRRGLPLRPGAGQEAARGGGRHRSPDQHLGDAGAAALQPERPAHGRADPGRLGQCRRPGRDRELRVGRVPRALAARRARDPAARLDRRQRRSRQLPLRAPELRCGRGWREPGALVPRAVRQAGRRGAAHQRPGQRTELYEQAQVVFKEQAPWITIAHSVVFMPMRKEVTGYKIDPFGGHVFYGVDLEG